MIEPRLLTQALALGSLDIDVKGSLQVFYGANSINDRYFLTIGEIKSSASTASIWKAGHQLAVRLAVVATVLKAIEPTATGTLRGILYIRDGTVDIGKVANIMKEVQMYQSRAVVFPSGFDLILSFERIN